ncbi:DUF6553 family protein [Mediterraneibacter sp.]
MQDREKKEEQREKNIGLEGRSGLETDRQDHREESVWREAFYQELDAVKRQQILKERAEEVRGFGESADVIENNFAAEIRFMEKLWIARYGKRKPKKDAFVGSLMELKYIAEGGFVDLGRQKKKLAIEIITKLCLFDAEKKNAQEQELLLQELKNAFLKLIDVSRKGRGFTSIVFGMGQLSEESVAKKIADQISMIAFAAPHMLYMDKEFELLQKAALAAFRQEYPQREHFLKK